MADCQQYSSRNVSNIETSVAEEVPVFRLNDGSTKQGRNAIQRHKSDRGLAWLPPVRTVCHEAGFRGINRRESCYV
jgi:hypothetical protein